MDCDGIIERNAERLVAILTELFAMAGFEESWPPVALPPGLRAGLSAAEPPRDRRDPRRLPPFCAGRMVCGHVLNSVRRDAARDAQSCFAPKGELRRMGCFMLRMRMSARQRVASRV